MKKNIKIKFVDFWDTFKLDDFYIYKILQNNYKVVLSDEPDYIIYSTFGYDHLKYNCIRVFYSGENFRPNFNHCDYAIAFDYIQFEDRYFRLPYYLAFNRYINLFKIAEKKHLDKENLKIRNKFCNMVVSNGLNAERVSFYKELCQYKTVDSGGKILNNVGGPVVSKLDFQKKYKFSLAFENSQSNGYTTEKIVDAFASGGIPIYWGDPEIDKIFNKKAFINADDFKDNKELIEYLKKVDQDDQLYLSYIKEPMLLDSHYLANELTNLENFINSIFSQDLKNAKRKCDDNHFVIMEKKYYLLSDKIVKIMKPLLKFKTYIKNKLVR